MTGGAGYDFRKNPDDPVDVHVPNYLPLGRRPWLHAERVLALHSEFMGENPVRDNATLEAALVAEDGSVSPIVNFVDHQTAYHGGRDLVCGQRILRRRRIAAGIPRCRSA